MEKFAKLGWHFNPETRLVISPTGETLIHCESEPTDEQLSVHMLRIALMHRSRELPQCIETDTMFSECHTMARAFPPAMFAGQ